MTSGSRVAGSHRDLVWAGAIVLVAWLVRFLCAMQETAHPLGQYAWIDEQAYLERARMIRAGQWLPDRPFYQDPLFPYELAMVIGLVGDDVPTLRLFFASLGALTPAVVFWAGRRGLGRTEGLLAGWAAVFCGPLIGTDLGLEKEGSAALLAALGYGLAAGAASRSTAGRSAAAGCCWGLVALLRSNALVVGPIGTLWFLCDRTRTRRARLRTASGFSGGFVAALLPVVVVNAIVGDPPELLVTTWQAGPNFYLGNGPGATGTMRDLPFVLAHPFFEADGYTREARRQTGRRLTPGEVSSFWLREGLSSWRAHPFAAMHLFGRKLRLLASNHEIADNRNLAYLSLVAAPGLRLGVIGMGVILPCAFLARARPGRTRFWWFLVLTTGGGLVATALFFVVGRYRVPWLPGLLLLAAGGVVNLAHAVAQRRWRAATASLLIAALIAAVAWLPSPLPAQDRWGLGLRRHFKASLWADRIDEAIDALDDARALGPDVAANIERMMSFGPEHDRLSALIASHAGGSDAPKLLERARWLRQLPEGRAEGLRLIEQRLQVDPADPVALRERGAWWLAEPAGEAEALASLETASEGPQADPSALVLKAILTRDRRPLETKTAGRIPPGRRRVADAIISEGPARP